MRLRNTSRYPTDEVRAIVKFATKGVNMAGVAVLVKDSRRDGYGGRTWWLPERRMTLRLGPPDYPSFPHSNVWAHGRYVRVSLAEYERSTLAQRLLGFRHTTYSDGRPEKIEKWVIELRPYGGKGSPEIIADDWREGLVSVAAHEARHVWQFTYDKPYSEVDAERAAARALARWREQGGNA